jgi:hypothetical protein
LSDPEVELKELRATFNLRWAADMRAIKRWQKAHPGNDLTWPDHADMVVWLLGEVDRATIARRWVEASRDIWLEDNDQLSRAYADIFQKVLNVMDTGHPLESSNRC